MSLLTIIGILPLISAGLIALIPTKNSELIKRAAFWYVELDGLLVSVS